MTPSLALPSDEDISAIKKYGDRAVPVLSRYLRSKDDREREMAMRLLGSSGCRPAVRLLASVLRQDASPTVRWAAVEWLSQFPWEWVAPALRRAALEDPDQTVRKAASDLIDEHIVKRR